MLYQLSYVSKLSFHSYNAALLPFYTRAGDGARTRDIKLGRLALYQLSYSRTATSYSIPPDPPSNGSSTTMVGEGFEPS